MSCYYSNISNEEQWLTTTLSMLEITKTYFSYCIQCVSFQNHSVHFLSPCICYISPVWCNNFNFLSRTPIFLPLTRKPAFAKPKDVSTCNHQSFVCTLPPKCHVSHTTCEPDFVCLPNSISTNVPQTCYIWVMLICTKHKGIHRCATVVFLLSKSVVVSII